MFLICFNFFLAHFINIIQHKTWSFLIRIEIVWIDDSIPFNRTTSYQRKIFENLRDSFVDSFNTVFSLPYWKRDSSNRILIAVYYAYNLTVFRFFELFLTMIILWFDRVCKKIIILIDKELRNLSAFDWIGDIAKLFSIVNKLIVWQILVKNHCISHQFSYILNSFFNNFEFFRIHNFILEASVIWIDSSLIFIVIISLFILTVNCLILGFKNHCI